MARAARFWDFFAERYSKQPIANEAAYQKKLEMTRRYFRPDMDVLEFGCGTGSTAVLHAPHVRRIQAIDVSPKMIEIARGRAADAGVDNVDFQVATLESLQAPDGSFDAALGLNILHLLQDRDAAIARVYGLLRPAGVFVSSTVCLGDGMPYIRYFAPIGRVFGLMLKVFTADELEASLKRAGFAIEQRSQPGEPTSTFMVARKPD